MMSFTDQKVYKRESLPDGTERGSSQSSSYNISHGPDIDPVAENKLLRKCDARLIPIMGTSMTSFQILRLMFMSAWLYLLMHLDRSNMGNVKILGTFVILVRIIITTLTSLPGFEKDLHLRNGQFGILATVMSAAMVIFSTPSNLTLRFVHPGRYLGGATMMYGMQSPSQLFGILLISSSRDHDNVHRLRQELFPGSGCTFPSRRRRGCSLACYAVLYDALLQAI